MLSIIGILIVFGAVVGGYMMEHGKLLVLAQPAELIIIIGAAVGTVVTANPLSTIIRMGKAMLGVLSGSPYSKPFYTENIKMLFDLFSMARKAGTAKLEEDIDNPSKSDVFKKYPKFLKSHHALDFLCDTLRTALSGAVEPMDIDNMMEVDLEAHHREVHEPVAALSAMADSLPGLGIVAAVLGVVITMGALGGPKEEIGEKVAAALVGTFLGILMCYGVFGPIAWAMAKQNDDEAAYFLFLRSAAMAFIKGLSPMMAVELSRRAIPNSLRLSFKEMETTCRGAGAAAGAKEPAAKAA
jgi:chemotaxis protein MotA